MKLMVYSGSQKFCNDKAKQLAKNGELVQVVYNDFFNTWQINVFDRDKNGILV